MFLKLNSLILFLCSFPKTNVLWLVYLVDMLLLKKTFVSILPRSWSLLVNVSFSVRLHTNQKTIVIFECSTNQNVNQDRSSKDERDLRSLKKRLDKYNSAKEAIFDPFFSDLMVDKPLWKKHDQKRYANSLMYSFSYNSWHSHTVYVLDQQIQTFFTKFYFAKMWCNVSGYRNEKKQETWNSFTAEKGNSNLKVKKKIENTYN